MKNLYIKESKVVQENCTYTSEAHHYIASRYGRQAFWFQLIPAVIAASSAMLVAGSVVPPWFGWATVISGVVTAVAGVINPIKGYFDHLSAAKSFTVLKQEARALATTTGLTLNELELKYAVSNLQTRYGDIVRLVPPTDEQSMQKARERIKSGIHKQDSK